MASNPRAYCLQHEVADAAAPRVTRILRLLFAEGRKALSIERYLNVPMALHAHLARVTVGMERDLTAVLLSVLRQSGAQLAEDFPKAMAKRAEFGPAGTLEFRFDLTNPAAVEWAQTRAAMLVTGVHAQTRAAIQDILSRGFRAGLTPKEMARLIREVVWLTARDARAVFRYHQAAFKADPKRAAKRVATYAQRLHRHRAEMIARTETMAASNQGQLEVWRQARDDGVLGPEARKVWILTPDERLCPICAAIPTMAENHAIPIQHMFATDVGPLLAPPAHPSCRCTLALVFPPYPDLPGETAPGTPKRRRLAPAL